MVLEVGISSEASGAKLLLVGDHAQLSAVGAGGALQLLTGSGRSYELAEARRFRHEWEREASLRLRAGDTSVIEDYHKQAASSTAEPSNRPNAPPASAGWPTPDLLTDDAVSGVAAR